MQSIDKLLTIPVRSTESKQKIHLKHRLIPHFGSQNMQKASKKAAKALSWATGA